MGQEQYGRTPKRVLTDTALSNRAVRVYGILAMSAFQGNIARIGVRRIGELIGSSRSATYRALAELIKRGYVAAGDVHKGERAYYMLRSSIFGQKQGKTDELVSFPRRRLVSVEKAS